MMRHNNVDVNNALRVLTNDHVSDDGKKLVLVCSPDFTKRTRPSDVFPTQSVIVLHLSRRLASRKIEGGRKT